MNTIIVLLAILILGAIAFAYIFNAYYKKTNGPSLSLQDGENPVSTLF